jgi:hypothetical protein
LPVIIWWGGGGWLPPSATAPPNARLNPQLPIAVIIVHRIFSAVPLSFVLLPLPLPIAIVPPAGRCHHCIPLQLCCRTLLPAAAHTLPPLHAVACTRHLLPTAARTLATCCPLQSFPRPPPPAAAHTHAACCRTHTTAAAYCCTHAASTTTPTSTAASAAAGATSIDSLK